jgi:hypothetical protein
MSHRDQFGAMVTAGDAAAVRQFDVAVGRLMTFNNDPLAEVDKAIAIDPGLVMGHVLKGLLCVLGTERQLLPDARAALEAARAGIKRGLGPRATASAGTGCLDRRQSWRRVRQLGAQPG